jgi:hypothetical protein
MTEEPMARAPLFLPDLLMTILLRIVSLACLWYALHIWAALIGYSMGGSMRFDLVNTDLKAAGATLAILYPVAAIGLWLQGSWGPVIWTAAALVEFAMHEVYSDTFGRDPMKVVLIVAIAAAYLSLRLAARWLRPRIVEPSYLQR